MALCRYNNILINTIGKYHTNKRLCDVPTMKVSLYLKIALINKVQANILAAEKQNFILL